MKLDISAIVVCFNEAHSLESCLKSISFCKEVIVVDLGSTDGSVKVAKEFSTKVLFHEKVPYGEYIHVWLKDKVNFNWILLLDPDEVIAPQLRVQIVELYPFSGNTGIISLPWAFYFKKKRLFGTRWGGINKFKPCILNRNGVTLTTDVHRSRLLKPDFVEHQIPIDENLENVVHHFWMQSYSTFFSKHFRYIKKEGKSRYNNGLRTSFVKVMKSPVTCFNDSFFILHGYKDGSVGLFLSLFWAFYNTMSECRLWMYQSWGSKFSN